MRWASRMIVLLLLAAFCFGSTSALPRECSICLLALPLIQLIVPVNVISGDRRARVEHAAERARCEQGGAQHHHREEVPLRSRGIGGTSVIDAWPWNVLAIQDFPL